MSTPEGAFIEIIERTDNPDPQVIVPNEVRINGIPLLASADDPVEVHGISTLANDVVRVTLTLFARRVVIGHEPK
jgi:hypothetical protein